MALFTNARDLREVPLLTRFYQILVPDEMEAFLRQEAEIELRRAGAPQSAIEHFHRIEGFDPVTPEMLQKLAVWHEAICAVMDSMADDSPLARHHLISLDTLKWAAEAGRQSFIKIEPLMTEEERQRWQKEKGAKEGDLRVFEVLLLERFEGLPIVSVLWSAVIPLLTRPRPQVNRCPECHSAFIATRSGQYCSFRCRRRSGDKRRYRQLFQH